MMEERKIELKLQRIDLIKEIEKYNEKAELLGLEKIVVGGTCNTESSNKLSRNAADRYNMMSEDKSYDSKASLLNDMRGVGFKVDYMTTSGKHPTEDVFFIINNAPKGLTDCYFVTFS